MKIEEAIRYFERELAKIEEAEAIEAAAAEPDEGLLHAWCYEREATRLAVNAMKLIEQADKVRKNVANALAGGYSLKDVFDCINSNGGNV